MARIKELSFGDYLEVMKYQQEWRCQKRKGDMFVVTSGEEGAGKSDLTIATGRYLDKSYDINRIYFDWNKYSEILQSALKSKMLSLWSKEKIADYNADVGLDLEKFWKLKDLNLEPASVLHYDEAGRGASNREAMVNVGQYKAMQTMRHLRLVNLWCAPKLRVIEVYAREERMKFFIWVADEGSLEEPDRVAYIWSKSNISRLFMFSEWWKIFYGGTSLLLRKCAPDYYTHIPDLETDKYIPHDFLEAYDIRKTLFDALEYQKDGEKGEKGGRPEKARYKPGETLEEFKKRTGKQKSLYYKLKKLHSIKHPAL